MIRCFVSIAMLLFVGACEQAERVPDMENAMSVEYAVMPKPEELPKLKQDALGGSKTAAMKLSLWYMKFPVEANTSLHWTQIAAENGSEVGQYNLAMYYLSDNDPLNDIRAKYWLEKSAAQGALPAKEKLAEIVGIKK